MGGHGGGIYNSGTLTVSNSTISNNFAEGYGFGNGGGIYNSISGTATVSYSTLSGNYGNTGLGALGGGIWSDGKLTVTYSTLSNNFGNSGGGIYNRGSGTLTVTNSTLSNNSVFGSGGGIVNHGTATVNNSTLSGNSASNGGGFDNSGTLTVNNSTLANNSAISSQSSTRGGAICNNSGATLTVSHSTLSGNSATNGSGIYNRGTLNIANTIIANNIGYDYSTSSGSTVGTVNLIPSGNPSNPTSAANNLVTFPNFSWATTVASEQLNLGPLQNNGGPTFTMALLSGSPAINAGNAAISNASPISGLDQRGYARSSTAPSIGAFEFNAFGTATQATLSIPAAGSTSGSAFTTQPVITIKDAAGNTVTN